MRKNGGLVKEVWKDIKVCDGYRISNYGRVSSSRINSGKITCRYKVIKSRVGSGGYIYVTLNINGKRKTVPVHRLVAIHFIENPENKPCVAHLDGTRNNAHVSNLMWATHKENSSHTIIHGTRSKMTGRPKSIKPTKDIITGLRMTQENYLKIKNAHGSVQLFLDKSIENIRHLWGSCEEVDLLDSVKKEAKT